jgi:hypothetical protein
LLPRKASGKRSRVPLHAAVASVALLGLVAACERVEAAGAEEPLPRADQFRSPVVDRSLDGASEVVRTRGFSQEGEDRRTFLVHRSTDVSESLLSADECYVVVAVGSAALRQLELRLFDGEGREVARPSPGGPSAALHHCAPQPGTHYLSVRAAAGSGLVAVRWFRGPTGLEVRLDDLFAPPAPPVPPEQP